MKSPAQVNKEAKTLEWLSWESPLRLLHREEGTLEWHLFPELPELGNFIYSLTQASGGKTSIPRNSKHHHPMED